MKKKKVQVISVCNYMRGQVVGNCSGGRRRSSFHAMVYTYSVLNTVASCHVVILITVLLLILEEIRVVMRRESNPIPKKYVYA